MIDVPTVDLVGGPAPVAMPVLGLGVWEVPEALTEEVVEHALQIGYRLIDTASIYGNENGVGQALQITDLEREDIFVTTKVWNSAHGYESTLAAFEESLERLDTDYVDLYLIHWPVPAEDAYLQTWRALRKLREDGVARAIGVCNFALEHLQRIHQEFGEYPSLNQIELHPMLTQAELRRFHAEHGIVTQDWSPLAARLDLIDDPVVVEVAEQAGCTPAQAIYRWHLEIGNTVLARSTKQQRLIENLQVVDVRLSAEQVERLSTLNRDIRTGPDPLEFGG